MTRSSNTDLIQPFDEPKRVFHLNLKLCKTPSLDYSSSPEFDLFFEYEDQSEGKVIETLTEPTMEEYMTRNREGYGSGIARPKIKEKDHFELKGQFLKELAFPMSLTGAASHWLRNEPAGSITTWETLKENFLSQYKAAAPGFYQNNKGNPSYQEQRQIIEESLSQFMAESEKIHEENSNLIQEIQASTDVAIRNQRASIKALEIQIWKISKALADLGASVSVIPFLTYTNLGVDFIVLDMPEDIKTRLILGRPFLSTAHAKINVFKNKITLRLERIELDVEARLIGESLILNTSLDTLYGDYIKLNDLNEPLELKRSRVDDLKPTIKEEDMDTYCNDGMGDIIVERPFYRKACVSVRRFDGIITIYNGNESMTYQLARSHPMFKHLTNAQCHKIRPLLKVSTQDELKDTDVVTDIRRAQRLEDLAGDDKLLYDSDIKAINILLLGLPVDIYTLINHYQTANEIWDRVKELIEGTEMTKQERESMLYNEFDKFTSEPGELIHSYYLRFSKLINDMNMILTSMTPMQINMKFVNHLQPEWSRFVTTAKQARNLHAVTFDKLYSFLKHNERDAKEVQEMCNNWQFLEL
nr:hypothetical protein [Tanacetum cinerariifolium]